MRFNDLFKTEWKYSKFIGRTTCMAIILSMLTLLSWANIYDEIDKLNIECRAGNKQACAKLADIAKNGEDKEVRKSAVLKLTDQALLADIAKNDKNTHVRNTAKRRLWELQRK